MAVADGRVPEAGNVFWVDLGEPVGHEQAGRRPVVVVSPRAYNDISSIFLMCPISRRGRVWPFQVPLPAVGRIQGYVLVDQIRAVDPAARYCRYAGQVDSLTLEALRSQLAILLQTGRPFSS
jgi:mRNA interferase MazF